MTSTTFRPRRSELSRAVLVVGGDHRIVAALRCGGYDVATASSLERSVSLLRRRAFSAIVLGAAEEASVATVTELRLRTDRPLIVIGEPSALNHKVRVLDAGADDLLIQPVDTEDLLAHVRARVRRATEPHDEEPVVTPSFTMHIADREVTFTDHRVCGLAPLEWRLVELLTAHAGHLVPHDVILTTLWGSTGVKKGYHLRTLMSALRKKLEPDPSRPRYFVTVPGLGVRFDAGA